MEPKYSEIFNNKILDSITSYCELNKIEDVDGFIQKCLKQGFDIKKYGLIGETLNEGEKDLKTGIVGEKQVEIEVIREIRVEVPIEIIKEVIVEKEVIKEVEKIVTITNNEELEEKIFQLSSDLESERKFFSTKTEEMENNFHYEMSKKDEELDELRRNLDDTNQKMLQETLQKLRKEISDKNEKIKELEKINQDLQNTKNPLKAIFMRGSNLNDRI